MTDKEALKLALEALETCEWVDDGDDGHAEYDPGKVIGAINTIREALAEQPAQQQEPKQSEIFCGVDFADGLLSVSVLRRRDDDVAELLHLEQIALPAQPELVPVTDNTYGYAKNLAEAIFKQHFASDEHYASGRVAWGVNNTVIGILTQIDNMVADMVRKPAQQQEPVAWGNLANWCLDSDRVLITNKDEAAKYHRDVYDLTPLYTSPPARKPWAGLTEAEQSYLARQYFAEDWAVRAAIRLLQDVEAKLREKNNG